MCNSHLIHQQKVTVNDLQQKRAEASVHKFYLQYGSAETEFENLTNLRN